MERLRRLRRPIMLMASLMALIFMGGRFLKQSPSRRAAEHRAPASNAGTAGRTEENTTRGDSATSRPAAEPSSAPDGSASSDAGAAGRSGAFYLSEEGRLYFVLEGEVLDATSGQPIEDFTVEATLVRSLAYGGPKTVQIERTDEPQGRFQIEGMGLGEWRVTGRAEGYAPSTQTVTLDAVDANPFLVIPLSGGTEVSGQVVDPQGRPVEGARVGLEPCFATKPPRSCRLVVTATDGRFLLVGAPAEEAFAVRAEHPRYGEAVRRDLRRAEGETEHVLLELSGILKVYGRVMRGVKLEPVADAQVRVRDPELETKTKADGTYQLFMPATAHPDVRVVRFNRGGSLVEFTTHPKGRSAEPIRWVEAETHVAELEKNFELESENTRLYGTVTDESGTPLSDVRLSVANSRGWKKGGREHETFPVETRTDAVGRYQIEHIQSHAGYEVRARVSEGNWVELGYVNVREESEVEANFQLGSGAIRGTFVHAETGKPFRMAARDCDGLGAERLGPGAFFIGPKCHDDGRFEFEKVPPGKYRLQDRAPWMNPPQEVSAVEVEVGASQIVDGVQLRVRGEEADTWKLRVTDERSRVLSGPVLRYQKDRTLYTSSLQVGPDGIASFSLSRAHPLAYIDHTGHESQPLDLAGRDPSLVIEVQLRRAP